MALILLVRDMSTLIILGKHIISAIHDCDYLKFVSALRFI